MTPELMKHLRTESSWSEEEKQESDRQVYMSLLGSLMFAAMTCRPDLAFSVSLLSQWGVHPRVVHLEALVRVLRYLVATRTAKLMYRGTGAAAQPSTGPQPVIYTDSDWGSEHDGLSRAGWTAKLAGGAVSWYSKKLALTSMSSAKAEYKALSEGAKEAVWLAQLLGELGMSTLPIRIYCDNQSALAISKNPIQHYKTRHFKLVRQVQEAGEVEVHFVRTNLQDADVLTKALLVVQHRAAVERLGVCLDQD
jgi:hypothetical protein